MKKKLLFFVMFLSLVLFSYADQSISKDGLIGKWELVQGASKVYNEDNYIYYSIEEDNNFTTNIYKEKFGDTIQTAKFVTIREFNANGTGTLSNFIYINGMSAEVIDHKNEWIPLNGPYQIQYFNWDLNNEALSINITDQKSFGTEQVVFDNNETHHTFKVIWEEDNCCKHLFIVNEGIYEKVN